MSKADELVLIGLSVIITDRVMETFNYTVRGDKKQRERVRKAIYYELERAEITLPEFKPRSY